VRKQGTQGEEKGKKRRTQHQLGGRLIQPIGGKGGKGFARLLVHLTLGIKYPGRGGFREYVYTPLTTEGGGAERRSNEREVDRKTKGEEGLCQI